MRRRRTPKWKKEALEVLAQMQVTLGRLRENFEELRRLEERG